MTDANTDGARMVGACTSGDEATVRELLRETPSLARQVLVGPLAPLHYAVREGHAGNVQLLLKHGADAHVVAKGGRHAGRFSRHSSPTTRRRFP
jgi:hypothetical protein